MATVLVTCHPGAAEWARRHGIEAHQIDHLHPSSIQPGDLIIGTLPIHLAAEVTRRQARYLHLQLDLPVEARGKELSADAMDSYGARLIEFETRQVQR
jgi:CRISPR-associated protein Csx16